MEAGTSDSVRKTAAGGVPSNKAGLFGFVVLSLNRDS